MSSVFSANFRVYNAEAFKKSIEGNTKPFVYLTIGKSVPWDDDNSPPQANTNIDTFNTFWKNMIGTKRIISSDVRLAIPRYNWTTGTVYTAHDHTIDSIDLLNSGAQFYVVTDEWNVYKCLSNNQGTASTTKPTSTITDNTTETADKYIWKYMYTVNEEERLRFVTDEYIPVRTLEADNGSLQWQVQDNAIEGSIHAINVLDMGSNYQTVNTISIIVTGDGNGIEAIPILNGDSIERIVISNPGSGYTYATVTITDTDIGSGANAVAIISPSGGHGSDPVKELMATNVIINPRLRGTESGVISTINEFRQVALIANPTLLGTDTLASNLVYNQTMTLTLDSGITDYTLDEFVYQGASIESSTFLGRVVSWDSVNNSMKIVNVSGTPAAEPLYGEASAAVRLLQSYTERSLEPYSGNLLYIDNTTPIQRADDQTEDFKIVVRF
jgi:hypothetical protein